MSTGVLVRADPVEVAHLAQRLRSAAELADAATSGPADAKWSGPAATAARSARVALDDSARQLRDLCGAASRALGDLSVRLEGLASRERAIDTQAADVRDTHGRWVAAGAARADPASALLLELRARQQALAVDYEDASGRAAAALDQLRTTIDGRPRGPRDQWEGLRDSVGPSLTEQAFLAVGAVADPYAWWQLAKRVPAELAHAATHPVETADQATGWSAWRDGRWGEGLGADLLLVPGLLAKHVPVRGLRDLVPEPYPGYAVRDKSDPWARNRADPAAPMPKRQTWHEMLAGVDLRRHEHFHLGHTLRRHVRVDYRYLRDRVDLGTLNDDGTRGHRPKIASAFTDRRTAERAITAVLNRNRRQIEEWMADPKKSLDVIGVFDHDIGRLVRREHTFPIEARGQRVRVRLAIKDGEIYINSAMVEP